MHREQGREHSPALGSPALAQHHQRAQVGKDASSLPADLQKQARGGDIFLLLYHRSNLDRKLLSAGVKCHSCTQLMRICSQREPP